MKKERREKVYIKYWCKCAYCGSDLKYKDMHVDHIIPKERFHLYQRELKYRVDDFENLNPSCRSCNLYKGGYLLEEYRQMLKTLHIRLAANSMNKVGMNYGIVHIKPFDGVFYFEKGRLKG